MECLRYILKFQGRQGCPENLKCLISKANNHLIRWFKNSQNLSEVIAHGFSLSEFSISSRYLSEANEIFIVLQIIGLSSEGVVFLKKEQCCSDLLQTMDFMKSLWLLCTAMHFVGNTFIGLRYWSKNRRYLQLNSELVVFYANSKNLNFRSDVCKGDYNFLIKRTEPSQIAMQELICHF